METLYRRAHLLMRNGVPPSSDEARAELEELRAAVRGARPPHRRFASAAFVPYPDALDPDFQAVLASKKEFAKHAQPEVVPPSRDAAGAERAWRAACAAPTPHNSHAQEFARAYLSPTTPYSSLMLFHGVGVGKTCAAVAVAEGFPDRRVLVLVNPATRDNFYREIFDTDAFLAGRPVRCAGAAYAERVRLLADGLRPGQSLHAEVAKLVSKKYRFAGYREFANMVDGLGAGPDGDARVQAAFANYVVVVDEAHRLGASYAFGAEDDDAEGSDKASERASSSEKSDKASSDRSDKASEKDKDRARAGDDDGTVATPALRRLLRCAGGVKLLLLTATPMFNSSRDVVDLLNLMLLNERRAPLDEAAVFDRRGVFRSERARVAFQAAAAGLVSYVRGVSPFSFPARFFPDVDGDARCVALVGAEGARFFASRLSAAHTRAYDEVEAKEAGTFAQARATQLCNVMFPGGSDTGEAGFWRAFRRAGPASARELRVAYAPGVPAFLAPRELGRHAEKIRAVVDKVSRAEGLCFVYTKWIWAGVVPLAIALEHAGFRRHGGGAVLEAPGGEPKRNGFAYTILCGVPELTRDVRGEVAALRSPENVDGRVVKVVIATEVATEGVDLRHVREVHVLDPWYHFNKVEQIVGRAARMCSHAALPLEKRNVTVYLHVAVRANGRATANGRAYQIAAAKAAGIAQAEDALVAASVDCLLNRAPDAYRRHGYLVDAVTSQGTATKHDLSSAQGRPLPRCLSAPPRGAPEGSTYAARHVTAHELARAAEAVERCLGAEPSLTFAEVEARVPGARDLPSGALRDLLDDMVASQRRLFSGRGVLARRGPWYVVQAAEGPAVMTDEARRRIASGEASSRGARDGPPVSVALVGGPASATRVLSSSAATRKSRSAGEKNRGAAGKWDPAAIGASLRRRVDALLLRLPTTIDRAEVEQAALGYVIDRLTHAEAMEAAAWAIAGSRKPGRPSKPAAGVSPQAAMDSLLAGGPLLPAAEAPGEYVFADADTGTFFGYDPKGGANRWSLVSPLRERALIASLAAIVGSATAGKEQVEAPAFAGYAKRTGSAGVVFKVFSDRAGSDGCVCHQTSTFTVHMLVARIRAMNAKLLDKNWKVDKRALCDLYELALRSSKERLFLRPVEYWALKKK
jgi:hypothetical protein